MSPIGSHRIAALRIAARLGLILAVLLVEGPARGQGFYAVSSIGLGDELTTLAISHRDPNFVLVGTLHGRILRTLDGGSTWEEMMVSPDRSLFYGRERQPDASWEYAPGLPGKSPYLQSWLRRSGLATSGINMAQLLNLKGVKQVSINWIEVDWNDERTVYVGTPDGLYRSSDKGYSFQRIFQGETGQADRMVNAVATDPSDRNRLLVGTASGMFSSEDRGRTFKKTMDYYMRDSNIREIWPDPTAPGLVHCALVGSAMASINFGKSWITTHWTDWAPRSDVLSFSLGPEAVRVISTRDGIYASWQGGEMGTWQRRGLRFIGTAVSKVVATRDPNTWYALTDQAAWVTEDAGNNWRKVFQAGGKEFPRWLAAFNGERRNLWMLTNRQIFRVGAPPAMRLYDLSMRASTSLLEVPPLAELARQALRHAGVDFDVSQRYRDRSFWAAFVPALDVAAQYGYSLDLVNIRNYQFADLPFAFFNRTADRGFNWSVMASWDLGRIIFSKERLPHWGRIDRNQSAIRQDLLERVHRLYVEYRRVARTLVYSPPADVVVRQHLELRLQEIAAYFDAVSGGHWSKKTISQNDGGTE